MITKLCDVNVMIIILNIFHFGSSMSDERMLMLPLKPANCFIPEHCFKCDYAHLRYPNYEFVAWFFDDLYKVCFPYYIKETQKNCCNGLENLPRTQKECEDMCGEPCIVTHDNYMTEPGICQLYCHFNDQLGVPPPCMLYNGWLGTACCPRGYRNPSFIQMEKEPLDDKLVKMIAIEVYTDKMTWPYNNKSILNNDVTADWITL